MQPHTKFTKDIQQKTPKNLKIALNSTKNNNSSKMNQELSTLPFEDPSYQKKYYLGPKSVADKNPFQLKFCFPRPRFYGISLKRPKQQKNTYLRFKEVLLYFFQLIVCLHWFNTEMGRFWPKFQFRFRQQQTLVLITVFYR